MGTRASDAKPTGKWQFWVDRGGTFTDILGRAPDGRLIPHKLLSDAPDHYDDAVTQGIRDVLQIAEGSGLPADQIEEIRLGTTVATNALLQRRGEKTALLTTEGLGDLLVIGQQHRDDLFALKPSRPAPLFSAVCEVAERVTATGDVLNPLDIAACRQALVGLRERGFDAVAILFAHGWRYPAHEDEAAALAREAGFTQISVSHQVSPTIKMVPRGDTAVVDAYLTPVLKSYLNRLQQQTGSIPLSVMASSGALMQPERISGKDAILSGPAGGMVGAAEVARSAGCERMITFDMGGTSTDVSHWAGRLERTGDSVIAGVRLSTPMTDIHTIAAGGGSRCRWADGRLQVGPTSAGADPGPACYGRGGPLTVTDCNLITGRLQPDLFPKIFGPSRDQPLSLDAALAAIQPIAQALGQPARQVASGFIAIAAEHMARAIRKVSLARGHDVRGYSLMSFGGAGGQHAALVAASLGMRAVIIPPYAGLLSALGIGLSREGEVREISLGIRLDDAAAIRRARGETAAGMKGRLRRWWRLRLAGSDTLLTVDEADDAAMQRAFSDAFVARFGFEPQGPIIAESVLVESHVADTRASLQPPAEGRGARVLHRREVFFGRAARETTFYRRGDFRRGETLSGPAIILEDGGTTLVPPDWTAMLDTAGNLVLTHADPPTDEGTPSSQTSDTPEPVLLEVFNNRFMSIAEEMGIVLAESAHSVNIKERLDFSCALFDAGGALVANAPHMPVHLGSMGDSVQAVISAFAAGSMASGDAFMLNDPYAGGTHLPDITVVTPVFLPGSTVPGFFVASRGHHADVGGITPGSMPAFSSHIDEEGVRLPPLRIVSGGHLAEEAVRQRFLSGQHPARNPAQNMADLKAQLAANKRGAQLLAGLCAEMGTATVRAYMRHMQDNAAAAVRRQIKRMTSGSAEVRLDAGPRIRVTLTASESGRMTVDFTGTDAQGPHNFNAPLAVTRAATLYAFRVMTAHPIPMNAGCLRPIDLIVPEGCLLNPSFPAAVAAGNVETSQAVTNAIFLAAGTVAASQGTMNNLTIGNAHFQYYETIAGGAGAGPGFDGTDAIQSHMTNSRLTDLEVLEGRHPVLISRFGIRRSGGGAGRWQGGRGAYRVVQALATVEASIISSNRDQGPAGLAGGAAGTPGRNRVLRANGAVEALAASDHITLAEGDCLIIETPGGGGYGEPASPEPDKHR